MMTASIIEMGTHTAANLANRPTEGGVLVFIYGTLKRGKSNHGFLGTTSHFIGPARTELEMSPLSLFGVPAVSASLGHYEANWIVGELYEVPADIFTSLEKGEARYGYITVTVPVSRLKSTDIEFAQMWLWPQPATDDTPYDGWTLGRDGYEWASKPIAKS